MTLAAEFALPPGEVHVWCAWLPDSGGQARNPDGMTGWASPKMGPVRLPFETLSAEESARAALYRFARDRQRFLAGRALLRALLGRYLGVEPAEVRLRQGPRGKPALERQEDPGGLRFNLSHSDGLALYAVTRGREVGVDVERVRPDVEWERLAERFYSPAEVTALKSLALSRHPEAPALACARAFYSAWTRKEAYLKAKGEGLAASLDSFTVSLAPGEPPRLLDVEGDPGETSRWSLRELLPAPGFVGALAVEGSCAVLQCRQLTLAG